MKKIYLFLLFRILVQWLRFDMAMVCFFRNLLKLNNLHFMKKVNYAVAGTHRYRYL